MNYNKLNKAELIQLILGLTEDKKVAFSALNALFNMNPKNKSLTKELSDLHFGYEISLKLNDELLEAKESLEIQIGINDKQIKYLYKSLEKSSKDNCELSSVNLGLLSLVMRGASNSKEVENTTVHENETAINEKSCKIQPRFGVHENGEITEMDSEKFRAAISGKTFYGDILPERVNPRDIEISTLKLKLKKAEDMVETLIQFGRKRTKRNGELAFKLAAESRANDSIGSMLNKANSENDALKHAKTIESAKMFDAIQMMILKSEKFEGSSMELDLLTQVAGQQKEIKNLRADIGFDGKQINRKNEIIKELSEKCGLSELYYRIAFDNCGTIIKQNTLISKQKEAIELLKRQIN